MSTLEDRLDELIAALGTDYKTYLLKSLIDAKGDLFVGTADNVVGRLAVGADGYAFVADSGQTAGVKWKKLDDSDIAVVASNAQTGDFNFVLADKHRRTLANKATALTGTIPLNATVAYDVGTILSVLNIGAGQFTWAITATGTLRIPHGSKSNGQYTMSYAEKIGTDEWVVGGDVTT